MGSLLIEAECEACGAGFTYYESQRAGRFCSAECYGEAQRGQEPSNKGQKTVARKPCVNCGDAITGQPAVVAKRRFCSSECFGEHYSGPNHYAWREGVDQRQRLFSTPEYKRWRKAVLIRDGGRCRWCDTEGRRTYKPLEVHHIVPISAAPELALEESNGITLCRDHHQETQGCEDDYAEWFASLLGSPLLSDPACNRQDRNRFRVGAERLEELYWTEGLSTREIGDRHGVTGACVLKHMQNHGIPRRSAAEARWGDHADG